MQHWSTLYNERRCTAEQAMQDIQSNSRVFMTGNCSVPKTLLNALSCCLTDNIEIIQVLTMGDDKYVRPEMQDHIRVNTMFISDNVREAVHEGRADYTPIFLSEVPALFRNEMPLDVALIHVSTPDEHGYCSFGVEVGVTKTAAEVARMVIAQVNPQMPRTLGDSFIHVSKFSHIVEVDEPLPEVRTGKPSAIQQAIGQFVAYLIEDGSTIQTGIGGIPDAVLQYLGDKRNLGIHTELFSDGVIDLVERGIINNEAKTFHPGKMIAGFVLGTQRLYDFIHDNPIVELHPTEYVNDPFLIARNDRMVAINSAIEVDLTGQVCADSIGPRFYSGPGGQVDFIRGAARSRGGKPIIALPSTAKGGVMSRIVPTLKFGAGVVTSRNDVHYVVTEYGVAYLHGKTIRERVQALINIAHPDFQEILLRKAHELGYLPPVFSGVEMMS
jgi:4-hydroxybutyrate CoA-transferase